MNKYYSFDVVYIRPSRTIETILLNDGINKAIVYLYNRDGLSYCFFDSILSLIQYFGGIVECEIVFEDEAELEKFLQKVDLNLLANMH